MNLRGMIGVFISTALLSGTGVALANENSEQLDSLKATHEQHPEDVNAAHDYAVALARAQNFGAALTILQQLYAKYPANMAVVSDYIVVLNWSGNNRAAVELYEKNTFVQENMYVKDSIAGAYYQLGDFQKARSLFHAVAATGDRKAKIWEAQSLMRLGDDKSAKKLYEELLTQDNKDIEVYLSRGSMYMFAQEYTAALADFEHALQLTATGEAGADARRLIHRDMAAAYIRNGEETKAIILLKPYIDDGTADVFMQGDYILALRLNQDYKTAISEGNRLWKDYGKVPVFGLQALADSYVRSGQVQPAIKIYQHVLERDPNQKAVQLGLAFAQIMNGEVSAGIKTYDKIITEEPTLTSVALDDAFFFMDTGRYLAGKKLYGLIVDKYPDNSLYRQEFAGALTNNNMHREAYDQYEVLEGLKDGEVMGLAGMASSAVAVGDYHTAKPLVASLHEQYARNSLSLQAIKDYERRPLGNLGIGYRFSRDYKGIQSSSWSASAEQNIGGSFAVLAEVGRNSLKDKGVTPTESTVLNRQSIGIQHRSMRHDLQGWFDNYRNNGSFSGYRFLTNHYLTDQFVLGLDTWKAPLEDVQALNPALAGLPDGRITTTNYRLRTDIQDGTNDFYSFAYTRGLYSDDNRTNSFDLSWNRTLKFNDKVNIFWYTYFGRTDWKLQREALYESPTVRETIGTGVTKRWIIKQGEVPTGLVNPFGLQQTMPKEYLEGSVTLEWGRDRPEPIDFAPYFRLEYGWGLSATRTLILGTEYGLRTDRLNNNSDLNFSYRQYDLIYRVRW